MAIVWCITQTTDGCVICTCLVEIDTNPAAGVMLALRLAALHLVLPHVVVVDHGRSTVLLWAVLRLVEEPLLRIHMPGGGRHTEGGTDGRLHTVSDDIHVCRRHNGQPIVCW